MSNLFTLFISTSCRELPRCICSSTLLCEVIEAFHTLNTKSPSSESFFWHCPCIKPGLELYVVLENIKVGYEEVVFTSHCIIHILYLTALCFKCCNLLVKKTYYYIYTLSSNFLCNACDCKHFLLQRPWIILYMTPLIISCIHLGATWSMWNGSAVDFRNWKSWPELQWSFPLGFIVTSGRYKPAHTMIFMYNALNFFMSRNAICHMWRENFIQGVIYLVIFASDLRCWELNQWKIFSSWKSFTFYIIFFKVSKKCFGT